MLQKSPNDRYQSVEQLIAELEQLGSRLPTGNGLSSAIATSGGGSLILTPSVNRQTADTGCAQATAAQLYAQVVPIPAPAIDGHRDPGDADHVPAAPSPRESHRAGSYVLILGGIVAVAGAAATVYGIFRSRSPAPPAAREVSIITEPAGALVAIVPIDSRTREYDLMRIQHPQRKTPVNVRLPSGDCLIVAKLDETRFHEVFRHVPEGDEAPGMFNHQKWSMVDNCVVLEKIVIPDAGVTGGMAKMPGAEEFLMGRAGSTELPVHVRSVPAFFIDTHEFTEGDFQHLTGGHLPIDGRFHSRSDRHAILLDYERAVAFAEKAGKRLLDEAEFEWAATAGGRTAYPWGNSWPDEKGPPAPDFPPTGEPAFDVLKLDPEHPVYGLCSNVAEWTTSGATLYPPAESGRIPFSETPESRRIVRGGGWSTINGDPGLSPGSRDPRNRTAVPITHWTCGFRCARSVIPRWNPDEFVTSTTTRRKHSDSSSDY
jgi:formylglycine-generating enzyme required for sulfatase activity